MPKKKSLFSRVEQNMKFHFFLTRKLYACLIQFFVFSRYLDSIWKIFYYYLDTYLVTTIFSLSSYWLSINLSIYFFIQTAKLPSIFMSKHPPLLIYSLKKVIEEKEVWRQKFLQHSFTTHSATYIHSYIYTLYSTYKVFDKKHL